MGHADVGFGGRLVRWHAERRNGQYAGRRAAGNGRGVEADGMTTLRYIVDTSAPNAQRTFDSITSRLTKLDEDLKRTREIGVTDRQAAAALIRTQLRADKLRESLNMDLSVRGAEAAEAKLLTLEATAGKTADKLSGVGSSAATAGGPSGMGVMVAAGVALAPVLVSVGFGLAGLAAAAYGIYKPISNAAQATGGLQKNMHLLNPEQQQVARGILSLGQQFGQFQKALQPAVFTLFNRGLHLAGSLMHDLEPVSAATGKALGSMLGAIDAEFQSGQWQAFFGFMSRTAGPDVQMISKDFTGLMQVLPPLVEALQPVASGILASVAAVEKITILTERVTQLTATHKSSPGLFAQLFAAGPGLLHAGAVGSAALRAWAFSGGAAAKSANAFGNAAKITAPKVWTLTGALNAALAKNDAGLLTVQGDDIAWKQSLQAATIQLNSNKAGLDGNSAKALQNKAAVLASSQAAQTLAEKQLGMRNGMQKASVTIQAQITWLQKHGDKSKFAAAEIKALRDEEARIKAMINSQINVSGKGSWSVIHSGVGVKGGKSAMPAFAAGTPGAPPGWAWVGEKGPELAYFHGGETVLPSHVSRALTGGRGFAGGVMGSFSGTVPGLTKWVGSEMNSTVTAIQAATAAAVFAGMKSAAAAAASPAGGIGLGGVSNSSAYAALQSAAAKKGWTGAQWAALVNVEMAEAGFNIHAQNPGSGAYGLAQFISGPSEYAQYGGNSVTAAGQAVGMVNYVAQRYGTPEAAWAHEQAFHWYGSGADMLVNRPTIFGAGERGPERVTVTPVNSGDKTGAETVRLLAALLAELRANPGATGEAVTAGLNGAARSAFYSGRYGAR